MTDALHDHSHAPTAHSLALSTETHSLYDHHPNVDAPHKYIICHLECATSYQIMLVIDMKLYKFNMH